MDTKYPLLSEEDQARNEIGRDVLLFSDAHHELYDQVTSSFYSKKSASPNVQLDPRKADGLAGKAEKIEGYVPHGSLVYPLEREAFPDVEYDRSISVNYDFPTSSHAHKSMLLRGAKLPTPALNRSDIEILKSKASRSGRSYGGAPLGHMNRNGRSDGVHYGPGGSAPRHYSDNGRPDRGPHHHTQVRNGNGHGSNAYNSHGGYDSMNAYRPPVSWQPPPPGVPGFGMGVPPPPPPAHLDHGNGYGQGHRPPQHSPPGNNYQNYRPPPPPGQDRNYRPPHGGDWNRNQHRDSRGYR